MVLDRANKLRWRWLSEPFGNTAPEINPSGLGAFTQPLRMPGQVADAETGLFYNYFRDYDASTGRYVQSDPIGLLGGVNTYQYARSRPLSMIDSDGLSPEDITQIYAIFKNTVVNLTECKFLLATFGWLGGIENNVFGYYFDPNLIGCYDQSNELLFALAKNAHVFDDKWSFIMVQKPGNYWVEGRSNNSDDPVVVLDPWIDRADSKPPGSKQSGREAHAQPGDRYYRCKK